MTSLVSIERDGAARAGAELERCIRSGGVAIFPADTLYGLACDPLAAAAIGRIDAIKHRPPGKPSAVLYHSTLALRELLPSLDEPTREALAALLPGPITVVVANPERRYPLACGADPERLGVRLIDGPLAGFAVPLLQTSANRSGAPPPARFEEIEPELLAAVDLAIDGGELGGEPSTVVDVGELDAGGGWRLLRAGAVAEGEIASALGQRR